MMDLPAPTKKPPEPVSWPGEPERKCGNCQHWRPIASANRMGDCHNLISRLSVTRETSSCARGWYPSVERFPLHERLGVQAPAKIASQTAIIEQNSASATSSAAVESMGSPPVGKPKRSRRKLPNA